MADATVRPAMAGDGLAIAWIQLEVWQTAFAGVLPETVLQAPAAELAAQWTAAFSGPGQTVLVAMEGPQTVGFAHLSMAEQVDDPVIVNVLYVRPAWARRGHGGRLLATGAAATRTSGANVAEWWIPDVDTATQRFAGAIGWEMSGGTRVLDTGRAMMTERRWTGSLDLQLSSPLEPLQDQ